MIPTRGAVQALAPAGRRTRVSALHTPKSLATRQLGNGRQFSTALRFPSGTAGGHSPLRQLRGSIPAGALSIGLPASSSRAFSLWGWGGSSKKPEPPAEPSATGTAPAAQPNNAPAQPDAKPVVSEPVAPEPSPAAAAEPTASLNVDTNSILPADLDLDSAMGVLPERIGFLAEYGLDYGLGPTSMMQWLLEHVHVYSGLPWWGSILATTLIVRALMWKPILLGQEHSTRLSILNRTDPRYDQARQDMMKALAASDNQTAQLQRQIMKAIEREAGVKKSLAFLNMLQIPIGYGMFRILKGMSELPVPGLEDAGVLWFSNLTAPDPYYILPLIGPVVMMGSLRITSKYQTAQQAAVMKLLSYVMTPLGFLITSFMPAAVQFYFVCMSLTGVAQSFVLMHPRFRGWMKLPALPGPNDLPVPLTPTAAGGSPTKPGVAGVWSNLKTTMDTARSSQIEKAQQKKVVDAERSQLSEDERIQAEYWEALRERMAEKEKRRRRP